MLRWKIYHNRQDYAHSTALLLEEAKLPNLLPEHFLEKIYPVGTIYRSAANVSPATFLGGAWVAINDYELVAYASLTGETKIGAKKNITSVTKVRTGTYTVNLSKAMKNTNYLAFVSCEVGGTGQEIIGVYNKTTSNFIYDVTNHEGSAQAPSLVNIAVFGQLSAPEHYAWKRTA